MTESTENVNCKKEPNSEYYTITDVDPNFYSIINENCRAAGGSLHRYRNYFNDSSYLKLKTGFVNEELSRVREKSKLEESTFVTTCEKYDEFVDDFERFLAENYYSSMFTLKKSERKRANLQKCHESCSNLRNELARWTSKVYTLKEKLHRVEEFRKFLFTISPPARFEEFRAQPQQLKKLLTIIEIQNLTSWNNAEKLSKRREAFIAKSKSITDASHEEICEMEQFAKNLLTVIEWEEIRGEELKRKTATIAERVLKKKINSRDVLQIEICAKDVHRRLIHGNIFFDVTRTMETIENDYEANLLKLNNINLETVMMTQEECYTEDKSSMRTAHEAAQKLKKLENLCGHLKKSL